MGDDRWWDHLNGEMDGRHLGAGAWWPLWWLLLVLVIVAVVALVVLSTRPRTTPPSGPPVPSAGSHVPMTGPGPQAADGAEALLRERYARGEIDEAEYDARLARLRASR